MTDETIVAVYDSEREASAAVRDLEAAGVPSSAIRQHAGERMRTGSATREEPREQGFWASLFGTGDSSTRDADVYDRSLANGSCVVTVQADEQYASRAADILDRHAPVDLMGEDTAGGVAVDSDTALHNRPVAPVAETTAAPVRPAEERPVVGRPVERTATTAPTAEGEGERIPLAKEEVRVDTRPVNRGTTRVRRYVVETPVEKTVPLHEESVSVERRPVEGSREVTGDNFRDKTVEVETKGEEAVVSKQARVNEEVVVNKHGEDREETVRDTVRREDVDVTRTPDAPVARNDRAR